MAYYDGDFDRFVDDRLKKCKAVRCFNAGVRLQSKTGKTGLSDTTANWFGWWQSTYWLLDCCLAA
jgi:hypothetical protein